MDKSKAIIVDLDGTLCNVNHRVCHVQKEEKDWKAFNEGMVHDGLYFWCFELIESMRKQGYKIIFVTGRDDSYRSHTIDWLKKHNVSYDQLYMRTQSDHRGDDLIKKDIYETSIQKKHDILFVLDDRLSVVKMRRQIGLICLQCDWGDF